MNIDTHLMIEPDISASKSASPLDCAQLLQLTKTHAWKYTSEQWANSICFCLSLISHS